MVHFKPELILLSLTIYFLAVAAAGKTSRNVSDAGYSYDKPKKPLDDPSTFEEGETTDEIITKSPTDRTLEEYLPPRAPSVDNTSNNEDVRFRRLSDEKKELHKTKRKFVNQQQFTTQNLGSGDLKERKRPGVEDEDLLADEQK